MKKCRECYVIHLTVIDLSHTCLSTGNKLTSCELPGTIAETVRGLLSRNCRYAIDMDESSSSSSLLYEDMVLSVTKFIKPEDQYCAISSLLLKSKAYHETVQEITKVRDFKKKSRRGGCSCCGNDSASRSHGDTWKNPELCARLLPFQSIPVVSLPLTAYGKPYIPDLQHFRRRKNRLLWRRKQPEWNRDILSISHQFPFVASGKFQLNFTGEESPQKFQQCAAMATSTTVIGLDIAVWDPMKAVSTTREDDSLQYFQSSFSDIEWDGICSLSCNSNHRMKEFHIRWSMKEAYTKSLGFGMALNFGSFELLPSILENAKDFRFEYTNDLSKFRWLQDLQQLSKTEAKGASSSRFDHRLIRVRHIKPNLRWDGSDQNQRTEFWNFWFLPLFQTTSREKDVSIHTDVEKSETSLSATQSFALACICTGDSDLKKAARHTSSDARVQVENLLFNDLVCWHSRQQTYETFR